MNTQPKPPEIIIMVAGAIALISAILPWYAAPSNSGVDDLSAFGEGLFPLAFYIPLIGLVMGLQVALAKFANVSFPDRILGFTWTQIHLALSIFAGLLALGYLIIDKRGFDMGIGLWLGILSSIGLVVGAVMQHMEGESVGQQPSAPPTPF